MRLIRHWLMGRVVVAGVLGPGAAHAAAHSPVSVAVSPATGTVFVTRDRREPSGQGSSITTVAYQG